MGLGHPCLAMTLNNRAKVFRLQSKYTEVERLYQQSLNIREKALGPDHPDLARVLENHADLLRKINDEAQAEKLEARAQAIRAHHAVSNPPQ